MRDEKIPIISFVANTGGLLGLCMGFSLVSVFEIIFHCGGAIKKKWLSHRSDGNSNQNRSQLVACSTCGTSASCNNNVTAISNRTTGHRPSSEDLYVESTYDKGTENGKSKDMTNSDYPIKPKCRFSVIQSAKESNLSAG